MTLPLIWPRRPQRFSGDGEVWRPRAGGNEKCSLVSKGTRLKSPLSSPRAPQPEVTGRGGIQFTHGPGRLISKHNSRARQRQTLPRAAGREERTRLESPAVEGAQPITRGLWGGPAGPQIEPGTLPPRPCVVASPEEGEWFSGVRETRPQGKQRPQVLESLEHH